MRLAAVLALGLLVAPMPARGDDPASPAEENETTWIIEPTAHHPTPWGLLDWHRTQGSAPRWERADSLSGSWGGIRDRLADDYGVALVGNYTAEVAGNPVGGQRRGIRYTHDVGLALMVDLGKLIGLDETYFLASASNRAGESNSARDIGNVFAVQQLFGGQTTRLVQLALGKRLFDGTLDVVAGRIHGLDDFIASPLYCNAQNLALCGNPLSIPIDVSISSYPNAAWGARARWEPRPALYVMGGVYDAFENFRANKYHGVDFSIRHDSGAIGIWEIGMMPDRVDPRARLLALPGHYKLGAYFDSQPLVVFETGAEKRSTYGLYLGIDQMVYREEGGDVLQGLTPFVGLHYAPRDVNQLEWFVDWGVVYQGPIPGRDEDVAGVYGGWGHWSPDLRASQIAAGAPGQTYELILEANYRWNLLPWFYLQPDIQGVINPGATDTIPNALVLALQFGVPF